MSGFRNGIKALAGRTVAAINPQCRYDRCIFVLAHMRCGSTALSNILCSRPDISGYGEAHIQYEASQGTAALGRLVVNQALRKSWSPRAAYLFDKILHARHDGQPPKAFFAARAIFIVREPTATVHSIRKLYADLGRDEYGSDTLALEYYIERLETLQTLWARFPASQRVAITHESLLSNPEAKLAEISSGLSIEPALENKYISNSASRAGGAGDPTVSGLFTRIETRRQTETKAAPSLDVEPSLLTLAKSRYQDFVENVSA